MPGFFLLERVPRLNNASEFKTDACISLLRLMKCANPRRSLRVKIPKRRDGSRYPPLRGCVLLAAGENPLGGCCCCSPSVSFCCFVCCLGRGKDDDSEARGSDDRDHGGAAGLQSRVRSPIPDDDDDNRTTTGTGPESTDPVPAASSDTTGEVRPDFGKEQVVGPSSNLPLFPPTDWPTKSGATTGGTRGAVDNTDPPHPQTVTDSTTHR